MRGPSCCDSSREAMAPYTRGSNWDTRASVGNSNTHNNRSGISGRIRVERIAADKRGTLTGQVVQAAIGYGKQCTKHLP
jgi:hypothetical protein